MFNLYLGNNHLVGKMSLGTEPSRAKIKGKLSQIKKFVLLPVTTLTVH